MHLSAHYEETHRRIWNMVQWFEAAGEGICKVESDLLGVWAKQHDAAAGKKCDTTMTEFFHTPLWNLQKKVVNLINLFRFLCFWNFKLNVWPEKLAERFFKCQILNL